jgi:hypothetical protein
VRDALFELHDSLLQKEAESEDSDDDDSDDELTFDERVRCVISFECVVCAYVCLYICVRLSACM